MSPLLISKGYQGAPAGVRRNHPNRLQPKWLTPYLSFIKKSPWALSLWRDCVKAGWTFQIETAQPDNYVLESAERCAYIQTSGHNASYRPIVFYHVIKALRDITHEIELEKRDGLTVKALKPEEILKYERARAADLESTAIAIAWDLHCDGVLSLWRFLAASKIRDMVEICHLYAGGVSRSPADSDVSDNAMAQIFQQFYACPVRLARQDHETLTAIDDGFYDLGHESLKADSIQDLTRNRDGKPYVGGLTDSILSKPFFNHFDDPANIHHLYQILSEQEIIWVHDIPFRDRELAQKFMDEPA